MDPITLSEVIARPREEIFDYLADIANHPEFSDHYLVDWHLTRADSCGLGAGARFRVMSPGSRYGWADATITECERPHRITELGRGGKNNRIKTFTSYTLTERAPGITEVEFVTETEPATSADRIMESFGLRSWMKRKARKGLSRLRLILEDDGADRARGRRATVAGID